jgi:HemY protein
MTRVVAFLVAATLAALGAVWLADRPGQVAITWLGYRTDTSVSVTIIVIGLIAIAAVFLWSLVSFLFRSPKLFRHAMRESRRRKAYHAVSRGLIAVGAGDTRAALRFAAQAEKSPGSEPLALLLRAQVAQLSGDRAEAEEAFRAMTERHDTRLLGLRGLFIEAQRRGDPVAAQLAAEEAAKDAPALPWAGQAVLEARCAAGDWEGALAILERQHKSGMMDRAGWRRRRAVLLTARAITVEDDSREMARALAVEATKLAPELVPAADLAGRLLADAGERRKASKIIEAAWKQSPHPDLAETYALARQSESGRERLTRMQALARTTPGDTEAALAVARAALDAREFGVARTTLEPLASAPTQRVAMLMSELEELEGDVGRSREWMARALNAARDPAWTADGFVSDRWLPVSPVTGRLDAFQWKVPVAELSERAPVVIDAPREVVPPPLAAPEAMPAAATDIPPLRPAGVVAASPAPRPAPIVPLAQVPDDPGPEPETEAELDTGRDDWQAGANKPWQRIRQLFR